MLLCTICLPISDIYISSTSKKYFHLASERQPHCTFEICSDLIIIYIFLNSCYCPSLSKYARQLQDSITASNFDIEIRRENHILCKVFGSHFGKRFTAVIFYSNVIFHLEKYFVIWSDIMITIYPPPPPTPAQKKTSRIPRYLSTEVCCNSRHFRDLKKISYLCNVNLSL